MNPCRAQAVQGRVERSLVDLEHAAGPLLDALGDAPSVHGLDLERLEHEHVERALKHVAAVPHAWPFLSTVESTMRRFLSIVKRKRPATSGRREPEWFAFCY